MNYKSEKHIEFAEKGSEYSKKLMKIKGDWFDESDYKKTEVNCQRGCLKMTEDLFLIPL